MSAATATQNGCGRNRNADSRRARTGPARDHQDLQCRDRDPHFHRAARSSHARITTQLVKRSFAGSTSVLVLEIDSEVAGWLTLKTFLPRCAYRDLAEVSVYVDEKSRRRGVGRALLSEAIARAPELGITAMVGLIFAHNEPSLRLFEQIGFEKWGLLPRVAQLDGNKRDLTVMGRHIPNM